MLKILIERLHQGKTCCLGEMRCYEEGINKPALILKTLEEDIESAERDKDHRIPKGDYNLFYKENSKFYKSLTRIVGWTQDPLGIYNDEVPKDRNILIHQGNTDKDTQGCILLGKEWGKDKESIIKSRDAIKEFYTLINRRNVNQISLTIKNSFVDMLKDD